MKSIPSPRSHAQAQYLHLLCGAGGRAEAKGKQDICCGWRTKYTRRACWDGLAFLKQSPETSVWSYYQHLFCLWITVKFICYTPCSIAHAQMDTSLRVLQGLNAPFSPLLLNFSQLPLVLWFWVQTFHSDRHAGLQYCVETNTPNQFYVIIHTKLHSSVSHCTYRDVIYLDVIPFMDRLCCCRHTFLSHDVMCFTHLFWMRLYDSFWQVWMWHWHFLHPRSARGTNLQT